MKRILICLGILLGGILLFLALGATGYFVHDAQPPDEAPPSRVEIPRYREVSLGFTHRHDGERQLPLAGAAMIDVDGDGRDEIFFGGGFEQDDVILRFDGQDSSQPRRRS